MPGKKPIEEFQLSLWKLLASEEEAWLGEIPSGLSSYEKEYHADLQSQGEPSSLSRLARSVSSADCVFVGDDHAVPQARESFSFLLERVFRHRQSIAIGLEMVHAKDQHHLDAFLQGRILENDFLKAVHYWEKWGFDWKSYRKILHFARENGVPVIALNSEPVGEDRVYRRDVKAAKIISKTMVENPGVQLFVLFGEQHVCESHLPRCVDEALRRENSSCRSLIIHQNATLDGPQLSGGPTVRVWQLSERSYRLVTTSPLSTIGFHLEWLETDSKNGKFSDREGLRALLLDRVHTVALALSVLLEQNDASLDRFEIFLRGEEEEALYRAREAGLGEAEIKRLVWEMDKLPAVNIPQTPYLLINDTSFPGACETAGLLLGRGDNESFPAEDPLLAFCTRSVRKGLGYFVAKLFDPYRTPQPTSRWLDPIGAADKQSIHDWKLVYKRFLQNPSNLAEFSAYLHGLSLPLFCALARSTGEIFGNKLYQFFTEGTLPPEDLRLHFDAAKGPGNGLLPGYFGFLRRGIQKEKA